MGSRFGIDSSAWLGFFDGFVLGSIDASRSESRLNKSGARALQESDAPSMSLPARGNIAKNTCLLVTVWLFTILKGVTSNFAIGRLGIVFQFQSVWQVFILF